MVLEGIDFHVKKLRVSIKKRKKKERRQEEGIWCSKRKEKKMKRGSWDEPLDPLY